MNEFWKKNKKIIISCIVVILLCAASFCSGRYIRFRRVSEDSFGTQQQIEQLQSETEHLRAELEARIADCDRLNNQLGRVGVGIDESIRTAGSIREEIESGRSQLSGSNKILEELRKRFIKYEDRIRELEEDLTRVKESTDK